MYERNKDEFVRPESIRVRQIVAATEDEAMMALRRLWKGEAIAKVASEVSIMPEKSRGGDLGRVKRGQMPDPFGDLVFELGRGIFNRPVKSSYGYHIFYLTDYKKEAALKFENVESLLRKRVFEKKKRESEEALLAILKTRYNVERHPGLLPGAILKRSNDGVQN